MGYQALLFCPDEKTARTVTQVLSELEFNVESCTEPFAAVKKLMSQHFDAVVVDCDNEQNATLLFKSARNSTSNQGSLAVAVVEGQAGVAKAFRIGANLVLTKPINIEQAKGTLRVARGLLRKSEPAKPGAAAIAMSQSIPAATKPVPPVMPETQAAPASIPTASARTKPDGSLVRPVVAATSNTAREEEDLLEISTGNSAAAPSAAASLAPALNKFVTLAPQPSNSPAADVTSTVPDVKPPARAGLPGTLGRGAASAPAPARERQETRAADASTERPAEADMQLKKGETPQNEASRMVGPAPTFTFGGANAPAESSGGGKKLVIGVAAAAIFAAAAYAGWSHFQGRATEPAATSTETAAVSVASPQREKPSGVKPSAASAAAKTSASGSLSSSQPAGLPAKEHANSTDSAPDDAKLSSVPSSLKPSSSASPAGKTDDETEATAAPLVVKGGKAPPVHAKTGASDVAAPSMIGIATAGGSAPPPDLGSGPDIGAKPLLQTLNISQGVSRGLLFKKVQPVYPKNALSMRLEGTVELLATVSKTGDITHVKALSGDAQLTKAATEAVRQWKYKPYLLNGEPVEIQTQVTINFKLPK
jgi:TonB family protein